MVLWKWCAVTLRVGGSVVTLRAWDGRPVATGGQAARARSTLPAFCVGRAWAGPRKAGTLVAHQNAHGQHVADHLQKVASRVHFLVRQPPVMQWWRSQVSQWCEAGAGGRYPGDLAPLPVELAAHEEAAVLAAIHDHAAQRGWCLIGPHDVGDGPDAYKHPRARSVVKYAALKVAVAEYTEREARRLLRILKRLRGRLAKEKLVKIAPTFRFSRDCRCVTWGEQHFEFTVKQAACIALMRGRRWLGSDYILTNADEAYIALVGSERLADKLEGLELTSRFRDVFKGHGAWGTMILAHPTAKGLYRLASPLSL